MKLAVFAFTRRGCALARRAKEALNAEETRLVTMEKFGDSGFEAYRPPLNKCMEPYFHWADAILFIGSTGMAVRAIAPWVKDKKTDPAVLVMDEGGTFVISLLSGHIGGANAMARRLAEAMGVQPVITTATDVEGKFSVDTWATEQGCHISDMTLCKEVSAAILEHPIPICGEYLPFSQLPTGLVEKEEGKLGIYVGIHNRKPFERTLILTPRVLTLGLGCRRGTLKEAIDEAVQAVFQENDLRTEAIALAASIDLKANEQGLLDYCTELGIPVEFFTAEELKSVPGDFTPSPFVQSVTGVDNVCERSAVLAGGNLIVHKTAHNGVTVAVAEQKRRNTMKLYVVGIGPGNAENMTLKAHRALEDCQVIVGYPVYVDLVKDSYPGKELLSTPMTQEADRCRMAIEEARKGKTVAMVCSGDSGIYGMASLVYELLGEDRDVEVEVVPGLTAACSGGAVLGAPLTHDFAVISLSDRLTPWEKIEKRLDYAAQADLSIVLYNPRSHGRPDNLKKACDILLKTLPENRPCGVVRNIGRAGQEKFLLTLKELRDFDADMFCTVFVGNAQTKVMGEHLVTPRGYRDV